MLLVSSSFRPYYTAQKSPIFHAINNHVPGLMTANLPGNDGAGDFDIDLAKLKVNLSAVLVERLFTKREFSGVQRFARQYHQVYDATSKTRTAGDSTERTRHQERQVKCLD